MDVGYYYLGYLRICVAFGVDDRGSHARCVADLTRFSSS